MNTIAHGKTYRSAPLGALENYNRPNDRPTDKPTDQLTDRPTDRMRGYFDS